MGRKQSEETEKQDEREKEKKPTITGPEERGDELLSLTLNSEILSKVTNCVCLSMQRGFNLNMRAANSLVTAGLRPVRERIHGDRSRFKCPECHCRAAEVSVEGEACGGQ